MAKYVEVELSTGVTVKVYAPPSIKLNQIVTKKYPDPDAPIRESKSISGDIIKMSFENDPEYLREKARIEALRMSEVGDLTMLFALKDVNVPEDFTLDEIKDIVWLSDPEWKPREGTLGYKLDYIEWVVLANTGDMIKIQKALAELSGIDFDAVMAIEESFRHNVEGTPA